MLDKWCALRKKQALVCKILGIVFVIPAAGVITYGIARLVMILVTFLMWLMTEPLLSLDNALMIVVLASSIAACFIIYSALYRRDHKQLVAINEAGTISSKDYRKYMARFVIEIICFLFVYVAIAIIFVAIEQFLGIKALTDNYIINDLIILLIMAVPLTLHLVPSIKILKTLKEMHHEMELNDDQ